MALIVGAGPERIDMVFRRPSAPALMALRIALLVLPF